MDMGIVAARTACCVLLVAAGIVAGPQARADIATDLAGFFESTGMMTNVTSPGVYEGQLAGYYTGGGVYARAPSRNFQLVTIQTPSFRAGCGGIDLFAGGFSFVNSDQLVAAMRNIGENATGLLFQIGLSTISPKLSELMQEFTALANEVNQFNINSCETAANLLGSVMPRTEASSRTLCGLIGSDRGVFRDAAQARQACGAGGSVGDTLESARRDPVWGERLPDGNVTWRALAKINMTAADRQLAELAMTLAGTVVIPPGRDDDRPRQYQFWPPLPASDELIQAFLLGGSATLPFFYRCGDGHDAHECTEIDRIADYRLPPSTTGFQERIRQALAGLVDAMDDDRAGGAPSLTAEQQALLANSRFPVLKALTVFHAYSPDFARAKVTDFSRMIALDLLDVYLGQIYAMTDSALASLQIDPDRKAEIQTQVRMQHDRIGTLIRSRRDTIYQSIDYEMQVMTIERALVSRLSPGLARSYEWAKTIR